MGQQQLDKVGSFGREDEAKLYRPQVFTLLDKGHFLYGKLPTARYDIADPEMQGLIDSIKELGVLQAGEAWHFEDSGTTHVIFGERRTIALDVVNQERIENGEDPIPMRYKIRIVKALTPAIEQEALARKADENNKSKGNDWLTVAFAVKRQLALGVDPGLVLARWPMIESETFMEKLAADTGVTAAIPELQEALARGQIKVKRAVKIAALPLAEQKAAMEGKTKPTNKAEPKVVRMPVLKRLRDEIASDKSWNDTVTLAVLDLMINPDSKLMDEFDPETANRLRLVLAASSKPGRKSTPKPEKADGLTADERAETQRFLDAEAVKREEAEKENTRKKAA